MEVAWRGALHTVWRRKTPESPVSKDLTPEKALIFRIVHRDNVPWILDNGLHCKNSKVLDPKFVEIGNHDLIGKRDKHPVVPPLSGTLSDYIPFYCLGSSPGFAGVAVAV
jgi:hypothetical protein